MSRVDFGFLEKTDSWLLKSNHFPSKVGGKPSWLSLKDIPSSEDLQCKKCNKPMIFLCQVYAPIDEKDSCFHRTIFIFICKSESCCVINDNSNLIVWRSQLHRENEFYSTEPPIEDPKIVFEVEKFVKICAVCGISAPKHCSKCKTTSYCSREHQIYDWKLGHKNACGTDVKTNENQNKLLFEEWEIDIEPEKDEDNKKVDTEEDEERRMKEFNDLVAEGKAGTLSEISESELDSYAPVNEDKAFLQFRKKISAYPDQVLRYDRGGEPIWVAKNPKPDSIPNCEYCNSPRQFEFQILPQLLYSLHEHVLDWGTLVVYTCKNNCDTEPAYKKEFVFKQDFSNDK